MVCIVSIIAARKPLLFTQLDYCYLLKAVGGFTVMPSMTAVIKGFTYYCYYFKKEILHSKPRGNVVNTRDT